MDGWMDEVDGMGDGWMDGMKQRRVALLAPSYDTEGIRAGGNISAF